MTSTQKGKAMEQRTHKWLESLGFLVHTVQKNSASFRVDAEGKYMPIRKKGVSQDLFGLWDHVAILNEIGTITFQSGNTTVYYNGIGTVIFWQTKSSKQYGKQKDIYKDFPGTGFIVVWEKLPNGRYPKEPFIEYVTGG